ncbi:MAG: citrate synthase [Atopobiaceae bacterium]|jgi:citrate synthase|nr:citrate synthase [Atopobiaceae bacterium]MCH4181071.1 citrate synthase [Atopobiaceae bacterium]MCH4213433.1 citrate synthase [Atopobiaceae bacterium]MCH4230468.1 citrate synthase [Atopobiaceae bacterium]MCH4277070.1 citrate synthase [Atopobiaceae bacterium]
MAISRKRRFDAVLKSIDTSALGHALDVSPMPSKALGIPPEAERLYSAEVEKVPPELFSEYDVKRGLRNADGSGVLVGLTTISNVHGYKVVDGKTLPDEGTLTMRGYKLRDLVDAAQSEGRFGYEEVSYLLVTGSLPTTEQLNDYNARIDARRALPVGYLGLFPRTTASSSIMNVLARSTLLLYAFDETPDDTSPTHEIDVAISLLGRLPRIAAIAHAAKVADDNQTELRIPPVCDGYSMAETVLDVLRGDAGFTRDEAMMLDVMLMLHAEHGGGNNSTFACRVLSSSGTDAYSAYAAAMGSLKGPKHGGANAKVGAMIDDVADHVSDWSDETKLSDYLYQIARGEAFDHTGLVYGMGHAVYTLSDPRARLIKRYARKLAREKGMDDRLDLIEGIERLAPGIVSDVRGTSKPMCANIDLYTGFVYSMLGIPQDLFTPIFAIARLSGWTAHRLEELYGASRIIRPAYRSVMEGRTYVPLAERGHVCTNDQPCPTDESGTGVEGEG